MTLQEAWDALQAVPSYIEAQAALFASEAEPEEEETEECVSSKR